LWDRDRWSSDDFLGEVAIPLKGVKDGKVIDEWFQLSNEPKKTKDKNPNRPPGEVRIRIHFPTAEKKEDKDALKDSKSAGLTGSAAAPRSKGKISDKYVLGNVLGRCVLLVLDSYEVDVNSH
jgi:hypothetical protein